jgi:hypothetical protein
MRRETVEHPFAPQDADGCDALLMKTLPKVATEMTLHVLAAPPAVITGLSSLDPSRVPFFEIFTRNFRRAGRGLASAALFQ